jgi:hypothetical protein
MGWLDPDVLICPALATVDLVSRRKPVMYWSRCVSESSEWRAVKPEKDLSQGV